MPLRFKHFILFCTITSAAIAATTLIGLFGGLPILTQFGPAYVGMAPGTALSFLLLNTSVFLYVVFGTDNYGRQLSRTTALIVLIFNMFIIVQFAFGFDSRLEFFLIPAARAVDYAALRMAPITAYTFALTDLAFLLFSARQPRRNFFDNIASFLILGTLTITLIILISYAHGMPLLYSGRYPLPMALPTAISFLLLGIGILLMAGPQTVILRQLMESSFRAHLLRVFLPATLLLTLAQGFLWHFYIHRTARNPAFWIFIFAMLSLLIVVCLIGLLSRMIGGVFDRAQAERKQWEEKIQKLNAELEQRVIERTAQLEAANKELEAFSYSVSHDLRTPLRSINGFSQIIEQDYADKLDAQGKAYLLRVQKATLRMAQLIDDLLNLSRISQSEFHREQINLSTLANTIVANLQNNDPTRQVEVIIATDLNVYADENLMQIVLENLLGNAWKFTRKQPKPRIELGITQRDGKNVYFVRDNGAGFDMAYADKLFGAFQRLHAPDEFEGTGIGLATVYRIIQRHGGRIWAEGQIDQGATFYFTL